MHFTPGSIINIKLPEILWHQLSEHCHRKLREQYLDGEARELKAFGLIAGTVTHKILTITAIAPLEKNARSQYCQKPYMDEMMAKHAIPSETPLHKRGWIADPKELQNKVKGFRKADCQLIGSYHMHRVAWDHDKERETPTKLDQILGDESRMFMFIIAMINPEQPVIRAFFEGNEQLEVPVTIVPQSTN